MAAVDTILKAIAEHRTLSFIYKGKARTADPYILGYDDKGRFMLSAVQTSGGSGAGFRSFRVDEISNVEATERRFSGTHPDYYPRDPYFARVLGQV